MADEFSNAQCVIEGKLYWLPLRGSLAQALRSPTAAKSICFCVDDTLIYEPFFADFGPLNLGKAYRFCKQTHHLLCEGERTHKRVYFFCSPHIHHKANAAVLIGLYQVLLLGRSAEEVCNALSAFKPYAPFRDASCGAPTFHLTVFHCIKGAQKARDVGLLDWGSSQSQWSNEEYEHYEQVENGDLNWIVPGKLVAFSGPAARGNEIPGYRLHTPEDYWDYFRKKGVTAVVRLNKKVYDRKRFTDGGFNHYDLYFPDGSCPRESLLMHFLELAEAEPGALAVHCKAGLGRTGVLICCYMMKHFKFTAEEVIGYIRLCRPGSVIGLQQNFLCDVQAMMWAEGDMWRATRGINKPHLVLQDVLATIRAPLQGYHPHPPLIPHCPLTHSPHTPHHAYANSFASTVASAPLVLAAHAPSSPLAPTSSHALPHTPTSALHVVAPYPSPLSAHTTTPPPRASSKPPSANGWAGAATPRDHATPTSSMYNNNSSASPHPPPPPASPATSSLHNNNGSWGITGSGISGSAATTPLQGVPRPPAAPASADMSLAQHSAQMRRSYNGLTVQVPHGVHSNPSSAGSTPNSAKLGPATGPAHSAAHARAGAGPRYAVSTRSTTPQRFAGAKPSSASSQPSSPTYSEALAGRGPTTPNSAMRGTAQGILSGRGSNVSLTRSSPALPTSSAYKRSPSADISGARAHDLRSTLHTDTLGAAARLRHPMPERSALSADVSGGSGGFGAAVAGLQDAGGAGYTPTSAGPPHAPLGYSGAVPTPPAAPNPIATTPKAGGTVPRPMHARTLAPNGQPRKVPIPMLSQFHAGMANQSAASHKNARPMGAGAHSSMHLKPRPSMELKSGSRGSGMGGLATPDQARRASVAAQLRQGLASK